MSRCTLGNIRAIFELYQKLSHFLVAPSPISSEAGDVVPLVVGCPGEVHGVDLGATTECSTPRIENAQADFDWLVSDTST